MKRTLGLIALVIAIAGCASTGSSSPVTAAAAGSPSAVVATSAPPPAPSAEPSSTLCTTHACIAEDAEQLKGTAAKDNSIMTKVACYKSTAKEVVSGEYTVHCEATYSDDSVWDGIATVQVSKGNVLWEPTQAISYGDGG